MWGIITMVNTVNALLCLLILLLGLWGYGKKKDKLMLSIGIAFGLLGVSHVITILGLAMSLASIVIAIRAFAYLIVALGLFKAVAK
jgi:hypothetical protein